MSTKRKKARKVAPAKKTAAKKKSAPKAKKVAGSRGVRYGADVKKEVVKFVHDYNQQNGRGGQSAAARKFDITILTVSAWLRNATDKSPTTTPKGLTKKVNALLDLSDQISKTESQLTKLKNQYASLSSSIRADI